MPADTTPRVALVTGGSGAIGAAVARLLAEQGFAVAVGYRTAHAEAKTLAAELPIAVPVELDVTDPSRVAAAFAAVTDQLGRVSVLVNAAGTTCDRPTVRMRDGDWDAVLRTNLTGAFACIRQALPGMIAAGYGRIVSIGSISATVGPPGQANYAAAKAGLAGLTRSIAHETGRYGVTANVVAPGLVESRLTAGVPDGARSAFLRAAATGRPVRAAEVARAVLFCVDTAAFTGQVINVDGGFSPAS